MPTVRVNVTLRHDSALPQDAIVNTWHFRLPNALGPTTAELNTVVANLQAFYNTIDQHLSSELSNTADVDIYDLSDPKPRTPVRSDTFPLVPSGSTGTLPSEIALVLTYQAAGVSGEPQSRRRGRVYLGPFATAGNSGVPARPTQALIDAIKGAATSLRVANTSDVIWVVYSPTTDVAGNGETGFADVVGGWVDNAWDIQRRRGAAATSRSAWV